MVGEQDGLTSGKGGNGAGGKEAGLVIGVETEGSGLDG